MGKTTDKFISDMSVTEASFVLLCDEVIQFGEFMKAKAKEYEDILKLYHATLPTDRKKFDAEVWPKYQQISQDWPAKVLPAQKAMKAKLDAACKSLKSATDKFETYVKLKEKLWVGTKNSAPAAKDAIAKARKLYTDAQALSV